MELYQWIGLPLLFLLGWAGPTGPGGPLGGHRLDIMAVRLRAHYRVRHRETPASDLGRRRCRLLPAPDLARSAHHLARCHLWGEAIVLAVPLGWFGFRAVDLLLAVYTNSELIRPHRSLSDMVVPVCLRILKGVIIVLVVGHVVSLSDPMP